MRWQGGNSLLAVRMLNQLEERMGTYIPYTLRSVRYAFSGADTGLAVNRRAVNTIDDRKVGQHEGGSSEGQVKLQPGSTHRDSCLSHDLTNSLCDIVLS